jgi:hypothetical protein
MHAGVTNCLFGFIRPALKMSGLRPRKAGAALGLQT